MGWFILKQLFSILIQLIRIGRMSDHEKDLDILILRYQLDLAERKLQSPLKPNRAEKLALAVLVAKLKQGTQRPTNQLRDLIRLFQPETVLRWHRQLVRRKWTYDQHHKGGRAPHSITKSAWLRRMIAGATARSRENCSSWGTRSPKPLFATSLTGTASCPLPYAMVPLVGES